MNKRADNILILGVLAIMVIGGLAFFLGRSTAPSNNSSAPVVTADQSRSSGGVTEAEADWDTENQEDFADEDFTADDSEYGAIINSAPAPGYENRTVDVYSLPPEALDTIDAIATDGPYEYRKDGSTFQNREGLLPDEPVGYYREFTVTTPGSDDRGARRIVAGDNWEMFYTGDHYESFEQIVVGS